MFIDETDVTGTLMNRVYRIVWNASRQAWMVAAELTRGKTKSQIGRKKKLLKMISGSLVVSTSLLFTGNALAAPNEYIWDVQDGSWTTGSNWRDGIAPDNLVSNSEVIIDNNGEATISNDIIDLQMGENNLIVGKGGLREGSLVIQNSGQLRIDNLSIGELSSSQGSVLVTNNASLEILSNHYSVDSGTLTVGNQGDAILTLNKGGLVAAEFIEIAKEVNSTATINIGAAQGEIAVAAGRLYGNKISFGQGNGTLVFNHTDEDFSFNSLVSGTGNIEFYSGTTRFKYSNHQFFNGDIQHKGGVLAIDSNNSLDLGDADYNNLANYTQSADATLRLGVASMDNYAKLNVSGTANFAKDTGLDINVVDAPTLTNGGTLTSVISAGTLNASTFTMTDNSALYDFTYAIDGNVVNLKVISSDSEGNGVLDSVNRQGFTSGRGAAKVLDSFVNSGITGNDIDKVTTALGKLSSKQVSDAVAETLPLLVAGTTGLASNTMRGTNRVIQSRQASNRGLSSGDEFLVDKAVWLKPVGSWSRQQERNGVSGYDADSYGFVGGIDGEITPSSRLGFALSYMNTDVDGNGSASGNSADIDAYQLIAYGSHDLTQFENVEVSWQADVGLNKNDSKRYIGFMNRKATADYDSYAAHVGAGIGKRFQLTEQSLIMPSLRADYAYIKDESYTEKGAGALNLDVDSVNAEELILMAQVEANYQWNEKTSLSTTLGVGYDVINDDTSLTASYTGGGAAFTTEGMDPSPWLARAGVGATMSLNDMTELTASYDLEGREDFLNQTASVNMRWRF
jgi:autotransporter family porin